jgi:predicted acetyltransferase
VSSVLARRPLTPEDEATSAAVIERCGGVLENIEPDGDNPAKRRYWIALG